MPSEAKHRIPLIRLGSIGPAWYTGTVAAPRGEGKGGGNPLFLFFCLSAQRSVMAMIVPLPHYEILLEIFLKSEKKNVSESPPPPSAERRPFSGLAQNFVARHFGNFVPPPPPRKQTPWRRPCTGSFNVLGALSCCLRLILNHSDTKLNKEEKKSITIIRGGARLLRPLLDPPLV